MTNLTLIETPREEGWHVATVAELAALTYLGERGFDDMTQEQIFELVNDRSQQYCVMSKLALCGILNKDKDALVALVRKDPETWETFHTHLESAKDITAVTVQFLTAAAARVIIALATVAEETPPDGPDGGEDIPEDNSVEAVAA